MTKTLELVFRNAVGKEVVLSLSDPREDITKAQTDAAMQTILGKNVFATTGGDLVQAVEARIRTRDAVVLA